MENNKIKELTPLEEVLARLVHNLMYLSCKEQSIEDLKIIKIALKDYENLKKEHDFLREHYKELLVDYKKKSNVLEIIKKYPAVASFMMWSLYNERVEKHTYSHIVKYCEQNDKEIPSEEEFNLLKEML